MLSKRLEHIKKYLKKPIHFADIGSDHAYLPVSVCLSDEDATAIAGEVNQGPYNRAKQTVEMNELSHRIDVRKGNGLEILDESDNVNQVTICGMGGKLIRTILNNGISYLSGVNRLILQPNIDGAIVRNWLVSNQFYITNEEITEEDGYIYEIIVADRTSQKISLSEKEVMFGPYLMVEKNHVFMTYWQNELEKRTKLINEMKKATQPPVKKIEKWNEEIDWIKEVLEGE
ncbi:tRNA (adenine(22)-N(1))-methyltransferase [Gracilibacillus marinus]|uniref:tRNA (Adenine(22)-N(1))-methyltransferase n=1 Tax=Gracilibacillus marinus TaxID=630535 RepID=A0ABV8VVF9_9BACI